MLNLFTLKEAAEILGIKYERLILLCIDGKISYCMIGKRRMFFAEHLQEFKGRNNGI